MLLQNHHITAGSLLNFNLSHVSHCDYLLILPRNSILEKDAMKPITSLKLYSFLNSLCVYVFVLFYSAPGNSLPDTRFAYSISFVADGAHLLQEEGHIRYPDNEDFQSYALWIEDIGWGGVADHPLIPVVYQEESEDR